MKHIIELEKSYSQFNGVRVPWLVSKEAMYSTFDGDSENLKCDNGYLIASGEQGFVELMLRGEIEKGLYKTITPCFRNDIEDELHQKEFFKLELINILDKNLFIHTPEGVKSKITCIVDLCRAAFSNYLEIPLRELKIVKISNTQYDIEYKGIELGSYGYRQFKEFSWIYGTGCAESRIEYVKSMKGN